MIGVIVPAHNEELLLPECLQTLRSAAAHPDLAGEAVEIVVAADSCTDATVAVARAAGVRVIEVGHRCVGVARATATSVALGLGARWIASTDADTLVSTDWLAAQLELADEGYDAVCGIVEVHDWLDHAETTQRAFATSYFPIDGHPHVHGASMGFSADAYLRVGGWPVAAAHEDVELVELMVAATLRVARSARVSVVTSARRDARALGGFGDYLRDLVA